jgi:hypothetical protein
MSKLVKFIFAINLESIKLLEIKLESFSKKDLKKIMQIILSVLKIAKNKNMIIIL